VLLVEQRGSHRAHTWGINLYPGKDGAEWIGFDSMINLKPECDNLSRGIEAEDMRKRIRAVVNKLIPR
jgi:hypothetical protein